MEISFPIEKDQYHVPHFLKRTRRSIGRTPGTITFSVRPLHLPPQSVRAAVPHFHVLQWLTYFGLK